MHSFHPFGSQQTNLFTRWTKCRMIIIALFCDTVKLVICIQQYLQESLFSSAVWSSFHISCFNVSLFSPACQFSDLSQVAHPFHRSTAMDQDKNLLGANGKCLCGLFFNVLVSNSKLPGLFLVHLEGSACKQSFYEDGWDSLGRGLLSPENVFPEYLKPHPKSQLCSQHFN